LDVLKKKAGLVVLKEKSEAFSEIDVEDEQEAFILLLRLA
jgi:hypothetical protein